MGLPGLSVETDIRTSSTTTKSDRIMDALYAARVEEYRIETERAQGRRDAYATLLQTRREHCAAAVIQSCVRQTQQRSYMQIRRILMRSQAVVREGRTGTCPAAPRLASESSSALPA